jgi:hypothetical protein
MDWGGLHRCRRDCNQPLGPCRMRSKPSEPDPRCLSAVHHTPGRGGRHASTASRESPCAPPMTNLETIPRPLVLQGFRKEPALMPGEGSAASFDSSRRRTSCPRPAVDAAGASYPRTRGGGVCMDGSDPPGRDGGDMAKGLVCFPRGAGLSLHR